MKNIGTLFISFILILFAATCLSAQTAGDYQTQASGNWSTASIWQVYNGSAWIPVGVAPTGAETITVLSSDSVYVDVAVSITDTLINQGIIHPQDSLTITIASGGVLQYDRDAGSIPQCIWATGSTLYMTGVTMTAPDDRDQDYYNVVFNTPDLVSNLHMNWDHNTISGDITVISTGLARWYLTSAQALDSSVVTILGDVIVQDGAFSVQGTSNALTTFIVHHYGNVHVTGGNFSISRGSQGGGTTTWYLYEGDFYMADAETKNSTSTPGGARFIFTKDGGTQSLTLSNVSYTSNAMPVQVDDGTTLDMGTAPIEGTGIFVLKEYATLATANTGGVSGSLQTGGAITMSDSANYTFNGTSAQVTSSMMPAIVNDLTIDNAAGVTLSQATTINGVLHLVSGVFDNTIPFTLGPSGSVSYEGGSLSNPIDAIETKDDIIPKDFYVNQNYPNPFNPTTTIEFGLPFASFVKINLYNVLGEELSTIFKGNLRAGNHSLDFNAQNLTSGVYFYKIQTENNVSMKRMLLLK